jgi:hypothetical protein
MNRELLELYSDYLLSAFSYTTATGLSKLSGGAMSHDKITRFLSEKELNSSELWRLVKPLVREIEDEDSGVLIIDDTIEEKPYTDDSELVCWHYSSSAKVIHQFMTQFEARRSRPRGELSSSCVVPKTTTDLTLTY